MDAIAVIAAIGGIALLIGIFGGGIKAKEVEIPLLPASVRILSGITGITLLGIAIWLSIRSATPIGTPTNPTATHAALIPASTELSVIASDSWQDTNIQINAGDKLWIEYKAGKWSSRDYGVQGYYVAPGAESTTETYDCMPIPQTETGLNGLIGKIGDGQPFIVNEKFEGIAPNSGALFLRMNDCDEWLSDNDGNITVAIYVNR